MKTVIESVKTCWKSIVGLFKDNPNSYYYKMDEKNEPVKVCTPDDPQCSNGCGCKQTSDFTYDEEVKCESPQVPEAEEVPAEPLRTKEQIKLLSKLELQVMAENAGIKLSGKEKKQQILNKLVKHYDL